MSPRPTRTRGTIRRRPVYSHPWVASASSSGRTCRETSLHQNPLPRCTSRMATNPVELTPAFTGPTRRISGSCSPATWHSSSTMARRCRCLPAMSSLRTELATVGAWLETCRPPWLLSSSEPSVVRIRRAREDCRDSGGRVLQMRTIVTDSTQPFAAKKFLEIEGRRMAYIDEGEGAPIVFAHGNPTSSYLWRNVMPACRGLGRLIACDMIGMGDSEKLPDSGPDRYTYAEQRSFLFALWKKLGLDKDVVFVLHDAGGILGFDWTRQQPERVQGIAYMEAPVQPMTWADWPEDVRSLVQGCRSKDGETLVLEKNLIVENVLPGAILRALSEDEMAAYRAPFANAGEDRRPMLTWLRQIPIEGETPDVVRVATDCGRWLAESRIPKLFINAEPGAILTGRQREFCRQWRNQTEVTVKGIHFIQE